MKVLKLIKSKASEEVLSGISSMALFIVIVIGLLLLGANQSWFWLVVYLYIATAFYIYLYFSSKLARGTNLYFFAGFMAMIIVSYALIYSVLGGTDMGIHSLSDARYFSIVTWTTLGYGDITPNEETRAYAASQALLGYFYMGMFVAIAFDWLRVESDKRHQESGDECQEKVMQELDKKQFSVLISNANKLFRDRNREGLKDLIRTVLRPLQSELMARVYLDGSVDDSFHYYHSMCLETEKSELAESYIDLLSSGRCSVKDAARFPKLNLGCDIFLATPWDSGCIFRTLGRIGIGLAEGEFKQESNHKVIYQYPLELAWVYGGNHSIAQGVIRGEGAVVPNQMHDLSIIIDEIEFDGVQWLNLEDGVAVGRPRRKELGWAWEVGRFILKLDREANGKANT